ncbi:MAG: hypothetical protein EPO24_14000 [Bacteroidetes bacterium]|nr:MAG: hypothetical protein EPO24_14000 [Bacteroidota bacterium]
MKHSIILFLLVIAILGGCGSLQFTSQRASAPITPGVPSEELQRAMVRIEGTQTMVGFLNDNDYLYLSIVTTDRGVQRQMLARGFTVWFDREGGNDERFGIKFPLGIQTGDFRRMREEWGRDRDDGVRERPMRDSLADRLPPFDTTEVEILGPKEGAHERVKIIQLKQIALKLTIVNGRLEYVLKVPLTDNGPDPYAIGTSPGTTIGVGLVTAEFVRPDMPAGGMQRGMGMGKRRERNMDEEGDTPVRQYQQSEPLKVWATVQLAGGK